jgi:hypothetical protein
MTKRYQRGNQEGTNQRRTDNTMAKRYQRSNPEAVNQRRANNCIVSTSLIRIFLITALVSFGHCIVSPSLISTFLITPLVSQEGTNQISTDNTMTKRYQRGNQEGTNQ